MAYLLAIVAVGAVMIPALPASASQRNPRIVISANFPAWDFKHHDRRPQPSFAKREYERGRQAGARGGFDSGYRDGFRGQSFCDHIDLDALCHASKNFRAGYMDAFKRAYREGFKDGQDDRRGCRPRKSWSRR